MDDERGSLLQRANAVVAGATALVAGRFSDSFERCVAVGLTGSCARGDLSAVSDVDYCLVFDGAHPNLRDVDLPGLVQDLTRKVQEIFPAEPFARRFSVFWTYLDDLRHGHGRVGRFPVYDRGLFRASGKLIAGMRIALDEVQAPTRVEVGRAGVKFLLEEVRPQLRALDLFQRRAEISVERFRQLGPVLATKAVLMPVRLNYVLLPQSESRLFVSVEDAVRACAPVYCDEGWWQLVEAALRWRQAFPQDEATLAEAADTLTHSGRGLYRSCVDQHRRFAEAHGIAGAAEELASWVKELSSDP